MKALLEEMGLRPGAWAPGVDRDGIAQAVKREFSGLACAGVRRSGFGAMELYVVQATPAPEVYDDRARVDVVASFGGLVTRVVTLSGEALVQPGDTVVPGQVLIRGTEAAPHAGGEVTARVWAQGVGDAALFSEEAEDAGRQVVETSLEVNGARFPAALEIPFSTSPRGGRDAGAAGRALLPGATGAADGLGDGGEPCAPGPQGRARGGGRPRPARGAGGICGDATPC